MSPSGIKGPLGGIPQGKELGGKRWEVMSHAENSLPSRSGRNELKKVDFWYTKDHF
jgi:hypothetical protein